MEKKIKGGLWHLGRNMWNPKYATNKLVFDKNCWNDIVDGMEKAGMNTIFLDIGEALHYGSHPELAVPDAWTRQKMRREIKRLKEKGIDIVPKINFSAQHDTWLGIYERMLSTPEYYHVCRDIINEVCALFDDQPYIHLGLDEEDPRHAKEYELGLFRQKDLLWHDIQFFLDCARDCGKTPIMWGSLPLYHYEEFKEHIDPEDLILMHYHYHGVKEEHWIRTDSRQDYYDYYYVDGPYVDQHMEILERDDPFYITFRKYAKKSVEDGYDVIMACSNFYKHEHKTDDVVDMCVNDWPQEHLKGIITAPWGATVPEHYERHMEAIDLLDKAFKKYNY